MPRRIANLLKFRLERLVLRGPQYRLLLIAALIGLLSVIAGAIVHRFDPRFAGSGFAPAVWWSFLRLTDPGYLGDDTGTLERIVSTVLTVLGYVLFLGALIAIMTQWLNERMAELEAGLTPIAQRDHILIIGWTNRTTPIVRELLLSEGRVRRFLELRGARRLRIAILADAVTTALSVDLRERLGAVWNSRQIVLRSGSPLRLEHLRRVDFIHASAVILPASDTATGGSAQADTRAIKTLLSMANHPQTRAAQSLPLAVAEIFDSRKVIVAQRAYGGPIEILASDAIISRLITQNVRHRGLSYVYGELLTHGRGNEIYLRDVGRLAGHGFGEAAHWFTRSIALGVVRTEADGFRTQLNPESHTVLLPDDKLVLLARSYTETEPAAAAIPRAPAAAVRGAPMRARPPLRVLVLGWSHKVPAMLREFNSYADEAFHIDVVSEAPAAERQAMLDDLGFVPSATTHRQIEGDYTMPAVLERVRPADYDNIVLLGTDLVGSSEESDARSIVAYLLLRDILPKESEQAVLVELLDASNAALFRQRRGEVLISPMILSHMLAQVALRRELRVVFEELFGPDGAEIMFQPFEELELGRSVSFADISAAAAAQGEIALGVSSTNAAGQSGRSVRLNPGGERSFELAAGDRIIVLR